jgi:hypothetical protein
MPVPQVFLLLTHSAIDAWSMWLRLVDAGKNHVARTLSRSFWQQKNFHVNRLRVSSSLAKTGFLRESRAADSPARFPIEGMHRCAW